MSWSETRSIPIPHELQGHSLLAFSMAKDLEFVACHMDDAKLAVHSADDAEAPPVDVRSRGDVVAGRRELEPREAPPDGRFPRQNAPAAAVASRGEHARRRRATTRLVVILRHVDTETILKLDMPMTRPPVLSTTPSPLSTNTPRQYATRPSGRRIPWYCRVSGSHTTGSGKRKWLLLLACEAQPVSLCGRKSSREKRRRSTTANDNGDDDGTNQSGSTACSIDDVLLNLRSRRRPLQSPEPPPPPLHSSS